MTTVRTLEIVADSLAELKLTSHVQSVRQAAAELEALQSENVTLRNAQKACEDCDAITIQEVERLRTQNRELRETLVFIAEQGCEGGHQDCNCANVTPQLCVTEYCLPCYANAALAQTEVKP